MNYDIKDSVNLEGIINLSTCKFDNLGLRVLCEFIKEDIIDENKRKKLFVQIKKGCKEGKIWALLGKTNKDELICLQVASAKDISKEIVADIKCMLPLSVKDTKPWKSKFHENVFEAKYGLDVRCQKYRDMFERFDNFSIIIIEHEIYLKNIDCIFNPIKYAEVKYAYDTKALYWNAIKEEHEILRNIRQDENNKSK